jgi:hypothetical protein
MKRRIYTTVLLIAIVLTVQAQTQRGIDALEQAVRTFLASADVKSKDTHWSHSQEQWCFKYVGAGDTMAMPASLSALHKAFTQNVCYATASYFHSPADGPMPFSILRFVRNDSFFSHITGIARIKDNHHFYLINFQDANGLNSYHLSWCTTTFRDRNGRPFTTIDGYISHYFGGIWRMDKFEQNDPWQMNTQRMNRPISHDDLSKYETLTAQLRYLADTYQTQKAKGNEKGCDATVYMLKKVCDGFDGQLTHQQFSDLVKLTSIMRDDKSSEQRSRIARQANSALWKKVVTGKLVGNIRSWASNDGLFMLPNQRRVMDERYDYGFEKQKEVKVTLTGHTDRRSQLVSVQLKHPKMKPYAVAVDSGRFAFSMSMAEHQLIEVTDDQGHSIVLFTDSVPVEIDLTLMTLSGSQLNNRFADCQRRLRALLPERHLYMHLMDDLDDTVVDEAGYQQLVADAHQLQMDIIRENQDNLIPVWYLAENYTTMSHQELYPWMQPGLPYADHVALQPARAYYEGLGQRLPGKLFADAACIDTAGVSHRLSEYIGHGDYVVLYFWSSFNHITRNGTKVMKQLHKQYASKNLRAIGLAIDTNKDGWRQYIRSRKLTFDHLSTPEGDSHADMWNQELLKAYGIHSLPETIIFGPDGRIVSTGLTGDELLQKIASLPVK